MNRIALKWNQFRFKSVIIFQTTTFHWIDWWCVPVHERISISLIWNFYIINFSILFICFLSKYLRMRSRQLFVNISSVGFCFPPSFVTNQNICGPFLNSEVFKKCPALPLPHPLLCVCLTTSSNWINDTNQYIDLKNTVDLHVIWSSDQRKKKERQKTITNTNKSSLCEQTKLQTHAHTFSIKKLIR